MRKIFYFLLAAMTLTFAACGGNEPEPQPQLPEGALKGIFSVGENTKVYFSQGNLQYVGTWQFAEKQTECFGNNQSDDHRDLFGWGTGDKPNEVSEDNSAYNKFVEWGNNKITNGGNKEGLWRTLMKEEWKYLFETRDNAANLYKASTIEGNYGMVVLPDNWETPAIEDTYTKIQWADLEDAGAVFLPAAGSRYGTEVDGVGSKVVYWSSSPNGGNGASAFEFTSNSFNPNAGFFRFSGLSVRLVHDVK